MSSLTHRRSFLKTAALATMPVAAGSLVAKNAHAIEPLKLRRIAHLQQIQVQQEALAMLDVTIVGMAALMHGKHGSDIGIDLDLYTLYQIPKKRR